ncbi:DsrE family protein [Halobacterium litoreum]|uniref:DsrE family protein n=1 Tax=Halobacterium litoreum TaxID=2039234 RepID=A0ABD5NJ20_9EURY|nr:DsrE family protein [Halobacterium litoreum]UHH12166.1 DsrE family protein [Halobacterium litoreum]
MTSSGGIVVHVTTGEASEWQMAVRNLVNLVREESVSMPPERVKVVVNGPAVRFLLASSAESEKVAQMLRAGVTIGACANSLERFEYAREDLVDGVALVNSGVAEVVRAQQDGRNYLRLP